MKASGEFDVKVAPMPMGEGIDPTTLGRMSLDKTFHGDLEGTSRGEMLTASTAVKGSAAYVAMEKFTGTLDGRPGTFALHHTGVMTRGEPSLVIRVVPDSGTDQLAGLSGTLSITITGGKHFYEFEYTLGAEA